MLPLSLAAAVAFAVIASCRGRTSDGARPADTNASVAPSADGTGADDAGILAEPDARAVPEAVAEAAADDSADAGVEAAVRTAAVPPPERLGLDVGALDIGESDPCNPDLPAEVVAMRNEEDTALRRSHARRAASENPDDDWCTPGADCPEPLPDLNGDGRPEYLINISYCDGDPSWELVASTPEGYQQVLDDGYGRAELLTPRLGDGTRVVVTVHDCCCMSYVKVLRIQPDGSVERLYEYESDCGACATWVEEQLEAGATGIGQGAYEARPEIVADVLRGVYEPEDCSGTRYRLIEIGLSSAEPGPSVASP